MASSKILYVTKQLKTVDGKTPRFPSLPLVIPNDTEYTASTNELKSIPGAKRDKLIVVDEAIQLLKSIKKPVAVLSIAGPYRSGKSYVLSRLLGKSNAFDLGHTMNAKTFGIWMGTSVLECDSHVIVLLDTEGIDACTASGQEDTRIFVLTLLLSSYFIYNSKGVVNKSDLDKMNYFVKLAKSVAIKKGSKGFNPNEIRKHFPNFLWLLRDVTLLPTDENEREISPNDYLLKRVLAADDSGFDETTSDRVGRAIVTFFPSVNCVTLPPPSSDVHVMRNIEENISKLNPDFNKQIDDLAASLKEKVSVKKVFQTGEGIHGHLLACLTQEFVEEVNDPNNTPALANTWDSTIKLLINEVTDRLLKEYTDEFTRIYEEDNAGGPLEEGDSSGEGQTSTTTIFGIHHALMMDKNKKLIEEVGRFCVTTASSDDAELTQEKLLDSFKKKIVEVKMETSEDQEGKKIESAVVVGGILFNFIQENYRRSNEHCCQVFDRLYKPIKDKIQFPDGTYNFNNLRDDLTNLHDKYVLRAIGPAKWGVYDEKKKVIETDQAMFQRLAGYEEKMMETDKKIAEAQRQNQEMSEIINQLRQKLEDEKNEHIANMMQIQRQNEEVIARLNEQTKYHQEMERLKLKEFIETQRQRSAELAATYSVYAQNQQQNQQRIMEMMFDQSRQQIHKMYEEYERKNRPLPPSPDPFNKERKCCIQ